MNIYKPFNLSTDTKTKSSIVTSGIWTGDTGSLTTFFTSSLQAADVSGKYYLNVYNKATSSADSEVQFSLAYGDVDGYGAPTIAQDDFSTLPTKAVYNQFKNILNPEDDYFSVYQGTTAGGRDLRNFYVININRARYKERLDPGNISISLSGSVRSVTLIDDSGDSNGTTGAAGRVYNIVSGSLNIGSAATATINSYTASNGQGWGLFYPDAGVILLNPAALSASVDVTLQPATSSVANTYHMTRGNLGTVKLFNAISGGVDFEARRTENITSTYYFVRANSNEFNYSNNPSFLSGSTAVEKSQGKLLLNSYNQETRTYVTSVGLYNDANELIAVAKLSKPLEKSEEKELAIRVKLDF